MVLEFYPMSTVINCNFRNNKGTQEDFTEEMMLNAQPHLKFSVTLASFNYTREQAQREISYFSDFDFIRIVIGYQKF